MRTKTSRTRRAAPGPDEPMRVQLVGFGVVGRGLAKALSRRDASAHAFRVVAVTDRSGTRHDDAGLDLARLVRAKEKHGSIARAASGTMHAWDGTAAVREVTADLVVEVTPTNIVDAEPASSHIADAMRRGKHVVTANKGPFALRFAEMTALAERSGVALRYGASVCGAVPIIELVRDALVGNELHSIRGVMNGSCNFILSRMEQTGEAFDTVLEHARTLGVTETEPSQDIDGWDAASKLVILANALMGQGITIHDVDVTGIRGITPAKIRAARKRGRRVRLIASLTRAGAKVAPVEVDATSPLAVEGTLNVAIVETDLARDITLVGRGAGQMETASALLADLHAVLRDRVARGVPARARSLPGIDVGAIARSRVLTVDADRTVGEAVALMRSRGISQLPVLRDGVPVGSLSDRAVVDLLLGRGRARLDRVRVGDVMSDALPQVGPHTPVAAVARILEKRAAVLVTRGASIAGIVTRADLLRLVGA